MTHPSIRRFSFGCAACGLPIPYGGDDNQAVLRAANGQEAAGSYDGLGKVGGFQIPVAWALNDACWWMDYLGMCEHNARYSDDLYDLWCASLKNLDAGEPKNVRNGDCWRKLAAEARERLERAMREDVPFSLYHRGCWERGGHPGYTQRSLMLRDERNVRA